MDLLSSYANVGTDIESVINDLPLLNIFVPDLPDFSAEKWNVATDAIPMVAISLDTDSRKIKILNDQAQVIEVSRMEPPTFPVIVLKNNERVSVRRNNEGKEKGNERSNKIILKNEIYSYALTNDNVENTAEGSRFDFFSSWDSKVRTAYTKSLNCGNCFHRDFTYGWRIRRTV